MDLRLIIFLISVTLFSFYEYYFPRIHTDINRRLRWRNNYGLVAISHLALKTIVPISTVSLAISLEKSSIGLFRTWELAEWENLLLSIFLLDLIIYLQHIIFHKVPILWKIHRVHHSDRVLDTSTAARFHPMEIALSLLIKLCIIRILGVSPLSILVFEIVLNSAAIFNHANIYLPEKIDYAVKLIFVTPDMHRIHHSTLGREMNSNFGFNFSFWDRAFRTYKQLAFDKQSEIVIGVKGLENNRINDFYKILTQPFK